MLIGQSVLAEQSGSGGPCVYYGPWLPRGSDAASFVAEVMRASGGFTLDVDVEHKNTEDADSAATTAVSFTTITGTGTSTASATGLKELVRYKYTAEGTSALEWIHLRMNPPIWQPN